MANSVHGSVFRPLCADRPVWRRAVAPAPRTGLRAPYGCKAERFHRESRVPTLALAAGSARHQAWLARTFPKEQEIHSDIARQISLAEFLSRGQRAARGIAQPDSLRGHS